MSVRVRHCVECPTCHTYYLIAFNPYRNGAYLVPAGDGSSEQYTLYCICAGPHLPAISKWRAAKACEVSKAAHQRGFGTLHEVCPVAPERHDPWFVSQSMNFKQSEP